MTLVELRQYAEPLGFTVCDTTRRGHQKGYRYVLFSKGSENYHVIFKPDTPLQAIHKFITDKVI